MLTVFYGRIQLVISIFIQSLFYIDVGVLYMISIHCVYMYYYLCMYILFCNGAAWKNSLYTACKRLQNFQWVFHKCGSKIGNEVHGIFKFSYTIVTEVNELLYDYFKHILSGLLSAFRKKYECHHILTRIFGL